jgi:polyhydroxybutyrate depolymerase
MLHGTSGDGEKFFNISGWREKADETGLIAVFPSALSYCFKEDENGDGDFDDPGELKVATKWASGGLGTPVRPLCSAGELASLSPKLRALADHPLIDDVAFFRAMLEVLGSRYHADERRIYVSGFSNGAQMAARLALEMSDRFAAVAMASSALELPPAPAVRPLPVVFSVGEIDDRFTTMLGIPAIPLAPTLFQDVPDLYDGIVTPMLTVLQLGTANRYGEAVVNGAKISGFLWSHSLVGASNDYRFLVIEGLSHQYPNGTNHPVVMADMLWEYFRGWSLPPGRR